MGGTRGPSVASSIEATLSLASVGKREEEPLAGGCVNIKAVRFVGRALRLNFGTRDVDSAQVFSWWIFGVLEIK